VLFRHSAAAIEFLGFGESKRHLDAAYMTAIIRTGEGILYRNPHPGHQVINAFLPCVVELSGELLCVYCRATAFYARDAVLGQLRSKDQGRTWQEEALVWDPQARNEKYSYTAPFLTRLQDGSLLLAAFRMDRSNPGQLAVNPDTGAFLPNETILFRSSDNGQHWSPPQVLDLGETIVDLAGCIVELQNDEWFLPFDKGKAYGDPAPVKAMMLGFLSKDRGQTWRTSIAFADGAPNNKAHWHGRVIKQHDGKLFTLLWTKHLDSGQFGTLHRTTSDPTGRKWDEPQPTGIPGQTSWTVDLGEGRMLTAYAIRQGQPPGIRAVASLDGGKTWDLDHEIVLWDATGRETIGVASRNAYPVSHDVIGFGRPQATPMACGDVLVSYWCTESCVTQARWHRLRLA